MITHKQLSLSDIFKDCEKLIEEDKPAFLSLLESLIDLDEIVPVSFRNHYHAWTGRPRSYSLDSMLSSSCGRMTYIYPEQDLRAYPGVLRGTAEWEETYKIRTEVERTIDHFKTNLCVAGRRTQNEKTLHADLILAGICQQLSVLVADKIHSYEHIKSLKRLIA